MNIYITYKHVFYWNGIFLIILTICVLIVIFAREIRKYEGGV